MIIKKKNIRTIAVSYTHLDVYKRQILICAAFAATLIVCGVSVKPTLAYFTTYATAKEMCIRDSKT